MAKSYYRIIDGIKYDRGLLDEAEKFQSENPQKKITVQKAKEFIESAGDGNIVTEVEKASLAYIAEHYPVSPQAKILLLEASKADKEKPKAKAAKKKAGAKKKAAKKKEKTSSTSPKLVPVDFPSAVKEEPDSDFSTEEPEDRLPPPAEEPKTEVLKAENLEQEMKVSEAEKKMEDLFPSFSDRLRKIEEDREVTRSKPEPLFKAPPKEVVKEPVEPPVTRKTELPPTAPRTPIIQKEEEKEEKKSGLLRLIILGLIVLLILFFLYRACNNNDPDPTKNTSPDTPKDKQTLNESKDPLITDEPLKSPEDKKSEIPEGGDTVPGKKVEPEKKDSEPEKKVVNKTEEPPLLKEEKKDSSEKPLENKEEKKTAEKTFEPEEKETKPETNQPESLEVYSKEKIEKTKLRFARNSNWYTSDSLPALRGIAEYLKTNPEAKIRITGHTCNRGSRKLNRKISRYRASSIAYFLKKQGIAGSQIEIVGKGESSPIASNKTKKGRERNRRVEFKILN